MKAACLRYARCCESARLCSSALLMRLRVSVVLSSFFQKKSFNSQELLRIHVVIPF
jgi:hypothetical protein